MAAIIKASHLWQTFGKSLWPWEVESTVPMDWMDAIIAYRVDYTDKQAKIEERKRNRRIPK